MKRGWGFISTRVFFATSFFKAFQQHSAGILRNDPDLSKIPDKFEFGTGSAKGMSKPSAASQPEVRVDDSIDFEFWRVLTSKTEQVMKHLQLKTT